MVRRLQFARLSPILDNVGAEAGFEGPSRESEKIRAVVTECRVSIPAVLGTDRISTICAAVANAHVVDGICGKARRFKNVWGMKQASA
jgi:hypothetical protein